MYNGPEMRLLIGCLASKEDDESACRLRGIANQKIDWTHILTFSERNRLAPLLYHNFRRFGIAEDMSPQIRQIFERTYHSTGFRNALYYEELRNLLRLFGQAGIKTIVLKGAAITDAVFKNVALRQMDDFDFLILEQNIEKSIDILSEAGYVPHEFWHTKEWYRVHHHHLVPYIHPNKGYVVELHLHIIPPGNPFGIDIGKLWERAQPAKIMDVQTLVLSPEDLMIHLCIHLARGGFVNGLKNLIDIVQVLRYYGLRLDWDWIIKEASKHNCINFVYYPLYLAKKLFDANIERDVLEAFKQRSRLNVMGVSLLNLMTRNILLNDDGSSLLPKRYLVLVCRQLLHDTPALYIIRSLAKSLFSPPDAEVKGFDGSPSKHDGSLRVQQVVSIFSKVFRHLARIRFQKDGIRLILLGLLAILVMSVNI